MTECVAAAARRPEGAMKPGRGLVALPIGWWCIVCCRAGGCAIEMRCFVAEFRRSDGFATIAAGWGVWPGLRTAAAVPKPFSSMACLPLRTECLHGFDASLLCDRFRYLMVPKSFPRRLTISITLRNEAWLRSCRLCLLRRLEPLIGPRASFAGARIYRQPKRPLGARRFDAKPRQ